MGKMKLESSQLLKHIEIGNFFFREKLKGYPLENILQEVAIKLNSIHIYISLIQQIIIRIYSFIAFTYTNILHIIWDNNPRTFP